MSKPHDIDRLLRDLRAGKFSYRIMDEAADYIEMLREDQSGVPNLLTTHNNDLMDQRIAALERVKINLSKQNVKLRELLRSLHLQIENELNT
jgi:hypothetical protein